MLIQNGKVISTGTNIKIPKNCTIIDLNGKSIYPSFIDLYTSFGIDKPKKSESSERRPLYDTKRVGYYWNESIKPEINGIESYKYDTTKAEELLKLGFGVVGTHFQDGIARGTGALIALNNNDSKSRIISNSVTNHFAFTKSSNTNQSKSKDCRN